VPKGVVLCISPWNFPLAITAGQIIAALVTGNTVIAKPSEHTTIIAYEFIKLLLAKGVPDDAINLVLGDGKVGEHIIKSQALDLVCFTGSLQTAKNIHQNLAQKSGQIVSLVAETGGLNAMVIDSSALLEQACDDVIRSAFMSAGQRCSALRIALIHEDVYQDFKAMLAGAMDDLVVGDPRETRTDVGPIISVDAATKIKAYVDLKRTEGFKIFCANENHAHTDQFIQPTFIEMLSLSEINQEIFGPVLHLVSFQEKNLEIVLQELKSKGFGLTFGIHSRIESKATKISKLVGSGNSYINRDMIGAVVGTQPFGGSGLSGTGHKAGGPNYLIQFVNEKLVSINTVAIGGNAELLNLETENGNSQGT
jgi:RHH-type proline utilization regulon transcriptional repressor/proline dehydrogenase/delta 1-pyrroline-5-carboxylate dehydrogenase